METSIFGADVKKWGSRERYFYHCLLHDMGIPEITAKKAAIKWAALGGEARHAVMVTGIPQDAAEQILEKIK